MAGNPFNFNMGAGGGIPMGRFRMSPRRPSRSVRSNIHKLRGARLKDPVKGGTVPMDAKHAREMSAQNAGIRAANKVSSPMLRGRQVPQSAYKKGYNEAFTKMANVKTPSRYKSPVSRKKQVREHRERIARDVGEKRSMASVDKFIKKEGRWPTMNESDRFAQTEDLKGMDSVYNFFKGIKPAQRASSLRGRYSKGKQ